MSRLVPSRLASPAGEVRLPRTTDRWRLGVLSAVIAAVCTGCGGGGAKDAPTVAPVTGQVTRKGAPLPGAKVIFSPIGQPDGALNSPSYAITDDSGKYTLLFNRDLQGALIAKHRVQINKDPAFDDNERPLTTGVIIPPQYNSQTTLEVEVPSAGLAGGTADFDLDF